MAIFRECVGMAIIPLGIETALEGSFHLKSLQIPKITGVEFYLRDTYTNNTMPINIGFDYEFSISKNAATKGNERFQIQLKPQVSNLIIENNSNYSFQLFPNPFYDQLTVKWLANRFIPTNIEIYNTNGQLIFSKNELQPESGLYICQLKHLPPGVYFINIHNVFENNVRKIIKF